MRQKLEEDCIFRKLENRLEVRRQAIQRKWLSVEDTDSLLENVSAFAFQPDGVVTIKGWWYFFDIHMTKVNGPYPTRKHASVERISYLSELDR